MKTEVSESVRNLRIALVGLIVIVVLLFIIGWIVYKPAPNIIQGTAEATQVRVSGKVPGRIEQLYVSEGKSVRKGDTLVWIDSPEVRAKLTQATAAERAARSQEEKAKKGARSELIEGAYEMWQKAKVGVDITKKSYDRVQRLYEKGVITAQKKDETLAKYQAALAQAAAAKTQYQMSKNGAEKEDKIAASALVDRARGAVQEVEAYLQETLLTAPISGEIAEIFPQQGELVGTGAPIMNIVDLKDMWFSFNIREDQLQDMKMGTLINVKIPALGYEEHTLKISYIKVLASYATWKATKTTDQFDVKTFEIRAIPTAPIADLRPGMSAILMP